MRITRIRLLLVAALTASAFLVLSFPFRVQSQGKLILGYIEEVRGSAYLKQGENKQKLNPRNDLRRKLYPGDVVGTDPGGYLRLKLCNRGGADCQAKEITSSAEFRIEVGAPARTEIELKREKAVQGYGAVGGRPQGVLSPFFSPAPDGAVRASTLVLRWVPSRELGWFSVTILDLNHQRLWGKKIANGAAGRLDCVELKQILAKYRDEHDKRSLILEVEDKNRIGSQSRFSLLSVQKEKALDQELADWDQEADVFMRHLGRAQTFFARDMFTEVAEEFEAALSETPYSQDLLARTIQAHRDTGNTAREESLKRRLGPR